MQLTLSVSKPMQLTLLASALSLGAHPMEMPTTVLDITAKRWRYEKYRVPRLKIGV